MIVRLSETSAALLRPCECLRFKDTPVVAEVTVSELFIFILSVLVDALPVYVAILCTPA